VFSRGLERAGSAEFPATLSRLLLIDDVQFFVGKKATLSELLHTVDTLIAAGRQLVFSSDRPPAELTGFGPELIARLSGGLVCRIEAADFATRRAVVRQICERLDIPVPDDVQALVAAQGAPDARELAGTCHRIQLFSLAHQQPVTRALAERVLAEHRSQLHRPVRLPDIQRVVCELFGLDPESLRSKCNSSSVNHPRTLAMWLARKHTRAALSEIGSFFGRKSHSSVISAQKKVRRWMDQHECLTLGERACEVEEAIRRVEELLRIA